VVDFTALAMAVVTMVLLMIVAVVRHKVDQLARGKEIFVSVLEAVYHECKFKFLQIGWDCHLFIFIHSFEYD